MKATAIGLFILISLSLAITPANSQTRRPPPRSQYSPSAAQQGDHPRKQSQTWYEFALSRINPSNINYGDWMEERRRVFLEATVKNPSFNYALALTIIAFLLMAACAKLWNDGRRKDWVTAEMMTDLLNQDQHSRAVANEAIRKYNDHIERCNRVIEATDSGHPVHGSPTEVEELRSELEKKRSELDAMTGNKNKLAAELDEQRLLVAQFSLRVDGLTKRAIGDEDLTATTQLAPVSAGEESATSRLMLHINNLQQQLYTEREKNRLLRGA